MAKEGNKSSGPKHVISGPCTDCGQKEGSFTAVRRYSVSGKAKIVRLCDKCVTKV
jgi:hypothetical protein